MALNVTIYQQPGSGRGTLIADSMYEGIRRHRGTVKVHRKNVHAFGGCAGDVAIFYGLHKNILRKYRDSGRHAVYVDLGYWGRHEGGRRAGYHKFAVNSRHPTEYFQNREHSAERFRHFGVRVKPWRGGNGGYILLAGMSAKAARAEGFGAEEWERGIVRQIQQHTDLPIVYRPKPNWREARGIPGTTMRRGADGDVESWFRTCHAVVTHHSNVAVEALLSGIPAFCWDGVATSPDKASNDVALINDPPEPTGVRQWAYDLAWTQWNVDEMKNGDAWDYLKQDALTVDPVTT